MFIFTLFENQRFNLLNLLFEDRMFGYTRPFIYPSDSPLMLAELPLLAGVGTTSFLEAELLTVPRLFSAILRVWWMRDIQTNTQL